MISIQLPDLFPSPAYIPSAVVDAAALPDPDRPHPPALTWVVPLESRPIVLGPSSDHPEVRPVLAIDADRFWTMARNGLDVGRARRRMDAAALQYALAPDLAGASHLAAVMADAAAAWDRATTTAALEMTGAL